MVSVDLKGLIHRLNSFCTSSLEGAAGMCVSRRHYEISIEHFLVKTLENTQSDLSLILRHFNIESAAVEKALLNVIEDFSSGNAGKPSFSPILIEWFQDAWLISSIDFHSDVVRSGVLLIGLLKNRRRYSGGSYFDYFEKIEIEQLRREFPDILADSIETPKQGEGAAGAAEKRQREGGALSKYTIDFTGMARKGEIDPVFGRETEIRQIIDILARRRKNNPIVVGEAGVGKTAIVEGLSLRIVNNDVPDILKNVEILGLDLGLLQAGAGVKGEFESRLKSVITEIKTSPKPIILFIDEAHTLIGAGGSAGGSDAANLLKPALARGELRTIAATTWSEYKKYFEKDPALSRRFQLIKVDEPSEEDGVVILRGLKEKYESAHNVYIKDDAVLAAVKLSSRYIHGRQLPDKAVDLLDTASARVKISLSSKPVVMLDAQRSIEILERELAARNRDVQKGIQTDDKRINEIKSQILTKQQELTEHTERWEKEKEIVGKVVSLQESISKSDNGNQQALSADLTAALTELNEIQGKEPLIHYQVDEEIIAKVVADWTGIPIGKMLHDEAKSLLELESNLKKRIKGQDHAIETISKVLRASKAGIGNPNAPLGVFLLVGPSGVGKTETSIAVADAIFGGERFMVTINMSEFQEKHTVSRLIGSPPGYVGYGEGGVLTEAVRQRPYSAVLLDEVEKADPEVMNLFYQVFDKGTLSDGEGRVINYKNTVIFMTSNLASDIIEQLPPSTPVTEVASLIRNVLSRHFKPALLARMTIVPFLTIGSDIMGEIVELKLQQITTRLLNTHKITLEYDNEIINMIVERCTEVETGARNVDHILNSSLLPSISSEILSKMADGLLPERIKVVLSGTGDFEFNFL
ncbi:MAG: type VI secretion system ATPase TssH [Nitrospirae bacterium]|nr:type VI secretion system ATPase TssH [Nitrospirota bacterium]